jgi:hypothetical protein
MACEAPHKSHARAFARSATLVGQRHHRTDGGNRKRPVGHAQQANTLARNGQVSPTAAPTTRPLMATAEARQPQVIQDAQRNQRKCPAAPPGQRRQQHARQRAAVLHAGQVAWIHPA